MNTEQENIRTAFTCTGPYAILIAYGLKAEENRHCWPSPQQGKCAMSVSKRFNRSEWQNFMLWAGKVLPPAIYTILPSWDVVSTWSGKIVATMDYLATMDANPNDLWYEGYPVLWRFSRVARLQNPIPCRGNIGMWTLPDYVSNAILAAPAMDVSANPLRL